MDPEPSDHCESQPPPPEPSSPDTSVIDSVFSEIESVIDSLIEGFSGSPPFPDLSISSPPPPPEPSPDSCHSP
jgi:hypothetical protein